MEMLIKDTDIATLYTAAKETNREFSAVEMTRLRHFHFLQLNAWEFSCYQERGGSIPHELWLRQDGWMRGEFRGNVNGVYFKSTELGYAAWLAFPDIQRWW
ncbi:MAG: hypothetical protein ACU84Q_01435 [Gammaproteobacteria bacterium]